MITPAVVVPEVNVQPGELHLARGPAILRTILGSCVSVTFWSARLDAGALCHGVLPKCPFRLADLDPVEACRYVDFSIRYLLRQFAVLGAQTDELQVKVFGGADVLPITRVGRPTVGAANCKRALEVLAEEGLRVLASDIGGVRGRRIELHTSSGEVRVYRMAAWSGPAAELVRQLQTKRSTD